MKHLFENRLLPLVVMIATLSLSACSGGDGATGNLETGGDSTTADNENPTEEGLPEEDTGVSADPDNEPSNPGNVVAQMSWTPPAQAEDGSDLQGLAGYRIYYGTKPGVYDQVITLDNPGATSYGFENLPASTWYFTVTAYDDQGNESRMAGEVSKTIQ